MSNSVFFLGIDLTEFLVDRVGDFTEKSLHFLLKYVGTAMKNLIEIRKVPLSGWVPSAKNAGKNSVDVFGIIIVIERFTNLLLT